MKLALACSLSLITLAAATATAAAQTPAGSPAADPAATWLDAILKPQPAVAAPTKQRPLHYALDVAEDYLGADCPLGNRGAGKVIDRAGLETIAMCISGTLRAADLSEVTEWEQPKAKVVVRSFPKKHRKKMLAAAKGATIKEASYLGGGGGISIYILVARDQRIQGVWVDVFLDD